MAGNALHGRPMKGLLKIRKFLKPGAASQTHPEAAAIRLTPVNAGERTSLLHELHFGAGQFKYVAMREHNGLGTHWRTV